MEMQMNNNPIHVSTELVGVDKQPTPECLIDSLKLWITKKIDLATKLYFNTDPHSFNDEIDRDMLSIRIFELKNLRETLECLNLSALRILKNFMILDNYVEERGVPTNGGNRNA